MKKLANRTKKIFSKTRENIYSIYSWMTTPKNILFILKECCLVKMEGKKPSMEKIASIGYELIKLMTILDKKKIIYLLTLMIV